MKMTRSLLAVTLLFACTIGAFAQRNAEGKYGITGWAINGQRVASMFNYDVDSIYGSGLGTFTYPAATCLLNLGGQKNIVPFVTSDTVTISDIVAANTETVALTSVSVSNGYCTLALSAVNTHNSYHLKSGTCGLVLALADGGGTSGSGTVIVDQRFYDQGCSASTITGATAGAVGGTGWFIHDISNGKEDWYTYSGSAFAKTSSMSGSGGSTSAGQVSAYCTGTVGTAETEFMNNAACSGATTSTARQIVAAAGTLANLRVFSSANVVGGSNKDVMTVFKNGSATAITCTIAASAASCADTTHSVAVAAGDVITFQFVTATSDTAANMAAAVQKY